MPLDKSGSKAALKRNISTLMGEVGKSPHVQSRKQALAVAYATQRRGRAFGGVAPGLESSQGGLLGLGATNTPALPQNASTAFAGPMQGGPGMGIAPPMRAEGGPVPGYAFGGFNMAKSPHMTPGFAEKGLQRSLNRSLVSPMTRGPLLSAVPGRTDAHKTHVPSGSYVIPADIVSGRGQGNTMAGVHALSRLFKMGPYGAGSPELKRGSGPKIKKFAAGGATAPEGTGDPVRVNLAGGEIVVPPENLMEAVHPNLETAHEIMDAWVLNERNNLRKTLAKLPGPVKD